MSESVKDGKYFNQSEISEPASVQFRCSFKTCPPPKYLFIFFPQPHTRSSLSPGTGTQSRHSYSGSASEGAGERASLWKLGNSRILVLNRRPPFLITEVRRLAFPTLSSLLLMAALTLRFETEQPRFTF